MKIAIGIVIVLFLVLVVLTILNYIPKRKPPQDHYYAERKSNSREEK